MNGAEMYFLRYINVCLFVMHAIFLNNVNIVVVCGECKPQCFHYMYSL